MHIFAAMFSGLTLIHSSFLSQHVSNEKNPGWLGYIGDEILPSYIGIIS